jgi:hypothetical protein
MTLLVTVDTAERIIIVSDRRVTVPKGRGGFEYIDDEWNKAVVVTCPEVQFGAVFAGLAAFVKRIPSGGLDTVPVSKHTSTVIYSCFQHILETVGFSNEIFLQFSEAIADEYRKIRFSGPPYHELTIFCHGYHMTQNMFAVVISNRESIKRRAPGKFDVELDRGQPLKRGKSTRTFRLRTYGTGSAKFKELFLPEVRELNRRGYFNRVGEWHIARRIAAYIRCTADQLSTAPGLTTVGKNCMSLIFFKEPLDGVEFEFCYDPYGPIIDRPWYTPLIVHAHDKPAPPFRTLITTPSGLELRP